MSRCEVFGEDIHLVAADLHVSEIRPAGQMLIVSFNNWIGLKLTGGASPPPHQADESRVGASCKAKDDYLNVSPVINFESNQAAKP